MHIQKTDYNKGLTVYHLPQTFLKYHHRNPSSEPLMIHRRMCQYLLNNQFLWGYPFEFDHLFCWQDLISYR